MSSIMAIIFFGRKKEMTDREIERVIQEGRKAIAERRNAELRARIAARREKSLKVLQFSCGIGMEEAPKMRECALIC